MPITIEHDIPITETRGRPPSEEHMSLLTIGIGDSFVSSKHRQALYQMAKTVGVKVRILSEGKGKWRVWKQSPQLPPAELKNYREKLRAERLAHRKARRKAKNSSSN